MQPIVAHHLLRCSSRLGMSGKAGDQHMIPLSHAIHVALHGNGDETAFLASYGIHNAEALAEALHANTGNHVVCIQLINEARQ